MTFEMTRDQEEGDTGKGKKSETLTFQSKVSGEHRVFMVVVVLVLVLVLSFGCEGLGPMSK